MEIKAKTLHKVDDPTASQRKQDHIDLALSSQVQAMDDRFFYEPMLSPHPSGLKPISFFGKTMRAPIMVSSMTGGTGQAGPINKNLARACGEFGLGMGLGSCRQLLDSDEYFEDFNLRPIIGDDLPFLANLGIAQLEQLLADGRSERAVELVEKLRADGLFIHVNPLQEWLQPEGDRIAVAPLETIASFIDKHPEVSVVVKEVGQGMGRGSLEALMQLPLEAIEFAAHGGTNFSKLEMLRNKDESTEQFLEVVKIGHSASDMVDMVNSILEETPSTQINCDRFIISGGVRDFLDGYYLTHKLNATAVYGQASAFLKHAAISYESLQQFIRFQLKGLAMAQSFLRIRQ